ncbi:hypothetical protein SAMN05421858_0075 [Haladaptatus litoreus]|uniref:Zinc-ribbon domain-containing protein n=1 Tax=Haladaptatus litoreus TaxID=553468 RepID=A0A1N6US58_9EURY|nr:hypothetical protein [Haladaptatus litoreus]SIQ68468.1 hypothetical protein SAMN05421858_0075 [Haladaptatus litoreus]
MSCEVCGASTRDGAKLCRDCGAPTPKYIEAICVLALVVDPFWFALLFSVTVIPPSVAETSLLFLSPLLVAKFPIYYGLFRAKKWAWGWAVVLFVAGALVGLVALWFGSPSGFVTLLGNGAIAAYIYSKHEVYVPATTTA